METETLDMLTHKGTQTIKTPRLTLRRVTLSDAQAMFDNWESDPAVTEFLTWSAHMNVEITKKIIASWVNEYEKNDYYHWAIVLDEIKEPIGTIAAVKHDDKTEMAQIGYCLGKTW